MSAQATAWAWEQGGLDSGGKLVLLALANEASAHGLVYGIHQRQLAESCGMSRSTVVRKLRELRDAGLVQQRWPADNWSANLYRLAMTDLPFGELLAEIEAADRKLGEALRALYPHAFSGGRQSEGPTVETVPQTETQEVLTLGLDLPEVQKDTARRRDLSFEALCEVTNFTPATARGKLNSALKGIRSLAADDGMTDDEALAAEIRRRGRLLRDRWGSFSPQALATWWKDLSAESAEADAVFETLGITRAEWDAA